MEILCRGYSTSDRIYERVNYRLVEDNFRGHHIYVIQDDISYKEGSKTEKEWRCSCENIFSTRSEAVQKFNKLVDRCCQI